MINKNGSMGNRFFLFCSFILLACFSVQAQVSFGEAKKFNENWLFSLSDDSLGASASYDAFFIGLLLGVIHTIREII